MSKQNNNSSNYAYVHYSTSGGGERRKIIKNGFELDAEEWAQEKEACISVASKGQVQETVQIWEFREIPNWLGRIVKGY